MVKLVGSKSDAPVGFRLYSYKPSMAAAILFAVLFALTALFHTWQMSRTRAWFMIPFILGGLSEVVGYVARAYSASESPGPYKREPYIALTICIIVAPTLLAASIYMELGRIVRMLRADAKLIIRRTWLTKIFVGGDIISFLTQGAGAGMLSGASNPSAGQNIILVGLFVQVVFFGLFVVAAVLFHRRMNSDLTKRAQETPWEKHMYSMYAVSLMILVRSIVRVVEYIQGFDGYIGSHEVFLYVFDALLMFVAMVILNWIHPGEVTRYSRQDSVENTGDIAKVGNDSVPMMPQPTEQQPYN